MNVKAQKRILVFLFLSQLLNGGLLEECVRYSFPKSFALRGYFGHFKQNLTGYPTKPNFQAVLEAGLEKLMNPQPIPEKTITFYADQLEPFAFAKITATNDGEDQFVLWGPSYSLTAVAAMRLNYRRVGF